MKKISKFSKANKSGDDSTPLNKDTSISQESSKAVAIEKNEINVNLDSLEDTNLAKEKFEQEAAIPPSVAMKEVIHSQELSFLGQEINGSLDICDERGIAGWALDESGYGVPVKLDITIDKELILQLTANNFRQDLFDSGIGNGEHAFYCPMPDRFFDGQPHTIEIKESVNGYFLKSKNVSTFSLPKEYINKKVSIPESRKVPLQGAIDGGKGLYLEGWAYDPESQGHFVKVEVYDGIRLIAVDIADYYREDLANLGKNNGFCAFHISLPIEYLDGSKNVNLRVKECSSDTYLKGSCKLEAILPRPYKFQIDNLDDQTLLCSAIQVDSLVVNEVDEYLELWVDGIWAEKINVWKVFDENESYPFTFHIPPYLLTGEQQSFVLTKADTQLVVASASFYTVAKGYPSETIKAAPKRKNKGACTIISPFINKVVASNLFDQAFYSEKVGIRFLSKEDCVAHYLDTRKSWQHSTSAWLDIDYINTISKEVSSGSISPIEWYFSQHVQEDIGPNILFSNADYQIQVRLDDDAKPMASTFFDDWLVQAYKFSDIAPSILIDLQYISKCVVNSSEYDGQKVIDYLQSWLRCPPEKREVQYLHPYFDQDWLNQCFVLNHNQPKGCFFTSFRLGQVLGQSPLSVIQQDTNQKDYYSLIREYEIIFQTVNIDDISVLCSEIDADEFYNQYPLNVDTHNKRRSSLYRYVTDNPRQKNKSFIRGLDDKFIAAEYDGLIDYCLIHRGIGDVNRIWSRWIRLLGLSGDYISASRNAEILSIQDVKQLKEHKYRADLGISASFIIPSYARDDLVLRCILSAIKSPDSSRVEFIIAEDAAHVDCAWILGYFMPFAKISNNPINLGFLLSCNEAVKHSNGEIFVLVNNDIIVHPNAVNEMLKTFKSRSDAVGVGGLILNTDGTVQENGGVFWQDASAWNFHRNKPLNDEFIFNLREVDYVSGCWIAIRRNVWDQIGGFDTQYVPAYCEESDFCMSCWQNGYKVYINPLSVVTHLDGATMGQDENAETTLKSYQKINRAKLQSKWKYQLARIYNKNGDLTPFYTGRTNPKKFISLVFDHYIPEPDRDAGSRTMFSICETLAAIENNYVIFIPANIHRSKYAADLNRLGIETITGSEGWSRFDDLIKNKKEFIKYVFVSRLHIARQYEWHLNQLNCLKSIYIHDVDTLRGFSYDPTSPGHMDLVNEAMQQYAAKNQDIFAKFNHIISCSEDETRLLKDYFGAKVIDMFPYRSKSIELIKNIDQRQDIVFVGSYNHIPNREAIQYFIEYIWSKVVDELPNARLHICGSGMESAQFLNGNNIILHGQVTDQTLAYLYSISRLSIAPLLTGAGIKGKVIESSANGVACVGTEVAWQGIELPSEYSYLSGSITTFLERLIKAYRAYDNQMASTLINLHEQCQQHNNISEVIPNLVNLKVK